MRIGSRGRSRRIGLAFGGGVFDSVVWAFGWVIVRMDIMVFLSVSLPFDLRFLVCDS